MIQELHLLLGGPAGGALDLQRHELGDAIHLAVTNQIGAANAQPSVQRPALADHHITRAQAGGDGAQIPACDLGRLPGPAGADLLNVVTAKCYQRVAGCASGQMALVVDGNVVMRASVMTPEFAGSLQIAGNYTQEQAEALAVALNHAT